MTAPREHCSGLVSNIEQSPGGIEICDSSVPRQVLALTCNSTLMDVRTSMIRVERFMKALGASAELTDDLNLVLSEAMTNIARYAYPHGDGLIECFIHKSPDTVECILSDQGKGFDPSKFVPHLPDPALAPEGGFGLFLIGSLTRELKYYRNNGVNTLRFVLPAIA